MLDWQDSPTMPGEVFYVPDPTHIAIVREKMPGAQNRWAVSSTMLGIHNVPLKAVEVDEAKREAEHIVARSADRLQERLNLLFRMLGPAEEMEECSLAGEPGKESP